MRHHAEKGEKALQQIHLCENPQAAIKAIKDALPPGFAKTDTGAPGVYILDCILIAVEGDFGRG